MDEMQQHFKIIHHKTCVAWNVNEIKLAILAEREPFA